MHYIYEVQKGDKREKRQIELKLKGFTTISVKKEGSLQRILQWYESFRQNENYAKRLDETVNRMRELKLH